ncbi:hypothetical protein FOA52_002782 [Chlamydomonas sp. UWO 241]|nr:hypothetical protein FOA52_002782 [Chlamydomonas sp. UWO 241]
MMAHRVSGASCTSLRSPLVAVPRASCSRFSPIGHSDLGTTGCADTHTSPTAVQPVPSRRAALGVGVALVLCGLPGGDARARTALQPGSLNALDKEEEPALSKFYKTPSGVKVQELLIPGELAGPTAKAGDTVLFDYVLRRANGYFIYGTIEGVSFQPKDTPVGPVAFKLGSGRLIPGLEEVLLGMRKGGKRRALIPREAGYSDCGTQEPQPPTFGTKRQLQAHCTEPLLFELEVLRVTS